MRNPFRRKSPVEQWEPGWLPPEKPIVTKFEPEVAEAFDVEGSLWSIRFAGDLVYLSGENGEVQAQFARAEWSKISPATT